MAAGSHKGEREGRLHNAGDSPGEAFLLAGFPDPNSVVSLGGGACVLAAEVLKMAVVLFGASLVFALSIASWLQGRLLGLLTLLHQPLGTHLASLQHLPFSFLAQILQPSVMNSSAS